MIYDTSDQVAVLFGGLTGRAMNDTWRFTLDQEAVPLSVNMDFSGDGKMGPKDLFLMASHWGRSTDPEKHTETDLYDRSNDGTVHHPDLTEFIEEWRDR